MEENSEKMVLMRLILQTEERMQARGGGVGVRVRWGGGGWGKAGARGVLTHILWD